ncbi:hypothetical protein EV702DRAFT_1203816 [Suillus placidus]|uniref:Uncharacterized protein n=1 Tax=Suillus placidus TaxID=48579 RepID=A0A9P6ZIV5_9AGAM|nr:hypothetical protein EV702DRAFT_1203816 [Suillus placidus]
MCGSVSRPPTPSPLLAKCPPVLLSPMVAIPRPPSRHFQPLDALLSLWMPSCPATYTLCPATYTLLPYIYPPALLRISSRFAMYIFLLCYLPAPLSLYNYPHPPQTIQPPSFCPYQPLWHLSSLTSASSVIGAQHVHRLSLAISYLRLLSASPNIVHAALLSCYTPAEQELRVMSHGTSRKITGLSKATITHGFRRSVQASEVLTAGKQQQRRQATDVKRRSHVQEMSSEDRDLVETMLADTNVDIDSIPYTAPPGEEGLEFSHKGREHEAFEGLAQQMADLSGWYAVIVIFVLLFI